MKDRRVQPPALQIDAPAINLASPRQAAVVTESAEDAEGFVPGGSNDHPGFAPVGPFGPDRLLMRDNTREVAGSNDYFSWRPGGQPEFAWAVGEDLQEIVAEGTSSTRLATVQEGFVEPTAEWKLLLRDAEAGTACVLSGSDPASYSREMMQLGSPVLSPRPAIDATCLVWAERFVTADGVKAKRIVLYDLESAKWTTVAEIHNISESDIWSPSISGAMVGWIEQPAGGKPATQVVLSLASNTVQRLELAEQPVRTALLDGGRYLALALSGGQFVADLSDGSVVKASNAATWMYSSGRFSSWPASSGYVGYYDAREKTIHLIDTRGAETVDAYVMGSYFVWQEFRTPFANATQVGPRESKFYALRLED